MGALHQTRPLFGIALKVVSTVAFSVMLALVKLGAGTYPVGELVFFRSVFGLLPVMVFAAWRGELPGAFRTSNPVAHLRRSAAGTLSIFAGFLAIGLLPIADATAISYATPLVTTAFAALLLGESVRIYRWSAIVVGFAGVLLILSTYAPGEGGPPPSLLGAVYGIVAAVSAGYAQIQIRALSGFEPTATIVIYFSSFAALASLVTLPFGWLVPAPIDAAMLIAAGLCGGVGQVLLTLSFRYAEASTIAPFDYLSMVWALVLSAAVFATFPVPMVLVGSAVVVAAGLFLAWREHRLGLDAARRFDVPPPTPG